MLSKVLAVVEDLNHHRQTTHIGLGYLNLDCASQDEVDAVRRVSLTKDLVSFVVDYDLALLHYLLEDTRAILLEELEPQQQLLYLVVALVLHDLLCLGESESLGKGTRLFLDDWFVINLLLGSEPSPTKLIYGCF